MFIAAGRKHAAKVNVSCSIGRQAGLSLFLSIYDGSNDHYAQRYKWWNSTNTHVSVLANTSKVQALRVFTLEHRRLVLQHRGVWAVDENMILPTLPSIVAFFRAVRALNVPIAQLPVLGSAHKAVFPKAQSCGCIHSTDFVEMMLPYFSSCALLRVFDLLRFDAQRQGLDWGVDLMWCNYLNRHEPSEFRDATGKSCALIQTGVAVKAPHSRTYSLSAALSAQACTVRLFPGDQVSSEITDTLMCRRSHGLDALYARRLNGSNIANPVATGLCEHLWASWARAQRLSTYLNHQTVLRDKKTRRRAIRARAG